MLDEFEDVIEGVLAEYGEYVEVGGIEALALGDEV